MVRGSSKMARGAVHPSDVLRAIMVDLEAIGIDSKGAETDRKLAETQMSSILCFNPFFHGAKEIYSEGMTQGSQGDDLLTTPVGIAGSILAAEIDVKSATTTAAAAVVALEHTVTENSALSGQIDIAGDEGKDLNRLVTNEVTAGGDGNHRMDVTDMEVSAPSSDSSVLSLAQSAVISSRASAAISISPLVSMSPHLQADTLPADIGTSSFPLSTTPLVSPSPSSTTPLPTASITVTVPSKEQDLPLSHSKNIPKKSLAESISELSDEHSISRSASAVSPMCFCRSELSV